MLPRSFKIQGYTRADRNLAISEAQEAVVKSGAWVVDFKLFSNKSINIVFEIPSSRMAELRRALSATGVRLFEESLKILDEFQGYEPEADWGADIRGTLQVTFIHNEPDLRIEVPAFE